MKLHNAILKDIEKHENKNTLPVYRLTAGIDDYFNIGISDGHFIRFYNDKHFYINTNCDYFNPSPIKVNSLMQEYENALPLKLTSDTKCLDNGKTTLLKLVFGDGTPIYIDEKFTAFFKISPVFDFYKMEFSAVKPNTPVFLHSNGYIYGVILPVKVND